MAKIKQLPRRSQVKPADTWDLSSLFPDDAAWETAFATWEKQIAGYDEVPRHAGRRAPRRWPRA